MLINFITATVFPSVSNSLLAEVRSDFDDHAAIVLYSSTIHYITLNFLPFLTPPVFVRLLRDGKICCPSHRERDV